MNTRKSDSTAAGNETKLQQNPVPSRHIFDKETGETFAECKKSWQKDPERAIDQDE